MLQIKYIKSFFGVSLFCILMTGCNFLDYNESIQYSTDYQFSTFGNTEAVLANIYSFLPSGFNPVDGAMRESATDDARHVWDLSAIQKFNDGSWSANVTLDDQWLNMYSGIRTVNLFLEEIKGQTFPEVKYNQEYSSQMEQFVLYPYEAKFLRAFFYFELIKRYGDVPLVTKVLTPEEVNKVTSTPFDTIVKYIVTECDSAAAHLPVSFTNFSSTRETGRATKVAAMALKARTLLYAASPLHNPVNDQNKWIEAAKASKDIFDQYRTQFMPLPAYTSIVNSLSSKELIFERRENYANYFEAANTAVGFQGGNTGTCPTQNLVDAYEMKATGLGINQDHSGYDQTNPYVGRDPRLGMTILYNNSKWKNQTVEIWNGGLNAPPKANTTKTGFYIKKYMLESISLDPVTPTTGLHNWVLFRFSEVLLNYTEAMNEAYGPDASGPAPLNNLTARTAVNFIRARTGVAMPPFPTGMTQEAFRDKLRNERRVELAFEGHRFWDIRRWKIGESTKDIYGISITKDSNGKLTYTRKLVESRVWNEKMNLYPIPQTELNINPHLRQNIGW